MRKTEPFYHWPCIPNFVENSCLQAEANTDVGTGTVYPLPFSLQEMVSFFWKPKKLKITGSCSIGNAFENFSASLDHFMYQQIGFFRAGPYQYTESLNDAPMAIPEEYSMQEMARKHCEPTEIPEIGPTAGDGKVAWYTDIVLFNGPNDSTEMSFFILEFNLLPPVIQKTGANYSNYTYYPYLHFFGGPTMYASIGTAPRQFFKTIGTLTLDLGFNEKTITLPLYLHNDQNNYPLENLVASMSATISPVGERRYSWPDVTA